MSAERLVDDGLLEWADGAIDDDYHNTYDVVVTTKGIFESIS